MRDQRYSQNSPEQIILVVPLAYNLNKLFIKHLPSLYKALGFDPQLGERWR
jgi:hypothetical protein